MPKSKTESAPTLDGNMIAEHASMRSTQELEATGLFSLRLPFLWRSAMMIGSSSFSPHFGLWEKHPGRCYTGPFGWHQSILRA